MTWGTFGAVAALLLLPAVVAGQLAGGGSVNQNCYDASLASEAVLSFEAPEDVVFDLEQQQTINGVVVGAEIHVDAQKGLYHLAPDMRTYAETNELVTPYGTYAFDGLQTETVACTAKTAPDGTKIPRAEWQVFTVGPDAEAAVLDAGVSPLL